MQVSAAQSASFVPERCELGNFGARASTGTNNGDREQGLWSDAAAKKRRPGANLLRALLVEAKRDEMSRLRC